ncbi:uncharacterized protein LOC135213080 isoform X3 [Macrobrachium nipponense]|uniref:uncharacterized protein LOC135213080 isoform X3 n=1 Tax=Macrobrachium nipponense TaxID=159736 RepID=UPI0030C7A5EB
MSSSGLKLRDPRELLANPDHHQAEASVHPDPFGSSQSQELGFSSKEFSTAETANSMSPSLAMANANSPPSNQSEILSTDALPTQNSSRDIEPIPKKRRLLEASEVPHELKESEKQPSSSDDILARACSAVGIGGDISESVVEEPQPNHQEHNGEMQRVAPNYPYSRGVRLPHQGIPLSPTLRHAEDLRLRHPFHPAFRPPSESTYGMEIRPFYNHGYPVPARMPIHPNEAHRYYAVPRYPNRYPYVGPPGSTPASLTRTPVIRPAQPNAPHERHPSIPHASQGYPYDPHQIPRPAIHHAPPTVPQMHLEHRVEPSEIRHIHPATSEIRPVQQSHPEIAYRIPTQHTLPVGTAPSEQRSPTSIKHPYPGPGIPIPIRPKLLGNPQGHLQDPRSPHARVSEGYAGGVIHGNHAGVGSPHPKSPNELSCENPFQIPEPQDIKNKVHTSTHSSTVPSHDVSTVKFASSLNEIKPQLSFVSQKGNMTEQTEVEITHDKATTRRPRQPPEPCVELIPIPAPSQEKYGKSKLNEKNQLLSPVNSPLGVELKRFHALNPSHQSQPSMENLTSVGSPKTYDESQQQTKNAENKFANTRESGSNMESRVNEEKEESSNKDPKKSFRKRWLDKQERHSSKRSAEQDVKTTERPKSEAAAKKEDTVIVLDDDDENVTMESNKLPKSLSASSKGLVGPGQLHCLHSSVYLNNMRSASEPPIGTSITSKNNSPLGNRPASVPCSAQQLQNVRTLYESQNKVNIADFDRNAKEKDNDDEFVNRLKLVLNDLISVPVPEVTKLQGLTCPIDELLASLVKRRGALPSEDPNPKERLRKDFLVLVKLCMPKNLLEDWGWNNSSPEEILDELIKVTNNGMDGSKGNARLNLAREHNPAPPTSSHTQDNNLDTAPMNHATSSSPCPIVSLSPVYQNSSPVPEIPVSSQHLEPSNQGPPNQSSLQRAGAPQPASQILIQYPTLPPQHHSVAHSPKQPSVSLHPVPATHHPPIMSPQQPTASPVYHHSSSSSQQPSQWPSQRHSVPPISRPTTTLSTNSEPSFVPPEDNLEDEVFTPTNRTPHPLPYSRPQVPVHPAKPVHESISQNIKPTQEHAGYASAAPVQMPSQNSSHPHNIPITVLHYSQVPQPPTNVPYGQHSSHPYTTPGSNHTIHNPPHYPRGPYPRPYPYAYYHPNNPHYPRPAYRHASILHGLPNTPPRHPYSPRSPHRSPNTHTAIRLVAQPPAPLSPSHWSERIVTSAAIKPPA